MKKRRQEQKRLGLATKDTIGFKPKPDTGINAKQKRANSPELPTLKFKRKPV